MIVRLLVCMCLWIVILPVFAATTAVGRAYVVDDVATAEQLAKRSAERALAGKVIDRFAERSGMTPQAFAQARNQAVERADEFLRAVRVERRSHTDDFVVIHLTADVEEQALERVLRQLGALSKAETKTRQAAAPRLMVLAYEEISGAPNKFPYVRQVLQEQLIKAGYRLVDQAAVERVLKHDQAVQAVLNGNLAQASNVALQFNAGVIITAHVLVQESSLKSGPMQAYGATLTMQAHGADNGRVIAAVTSDGSYPHINALQGARGAIKDATTKAMKSFAKDLKRQREAPPRGLVVSISNVNFEQLALIKQVLRRDFSELTNMRNLGFAGGVARLEVELDLDPTAFAEKLALKDYGSFKLEVLFQSPGKLDLALRI